MEDSIELLCKHCGHTFKAFLEQMADHNARVTCPKCGKALDYRLENGKQKRG